MEYIRNKLKLSNIGLDEDNPLWIGAWWMGFVIVGLIVLCIAPLMMLFPPAIPPPKGSLTDEAIGIKALENETSLSTVQEWWTAFLAIMKRLLGNKVYLFTLLSNIFMVNGIVGFAQFLPKYLEVMFRTRASTSGLIGPLAKTGAAIVGLITVGILIGKYRPKASTYNMCFK